MSGVPRNLGTRRPAANSHPPRTIANGWTRSVITPIPASSVADLMLHSLDFQARLIVKINAEPKTPSNESMNIGTSKFIESAVLFDHPPQDSGVSPCHRTTKGTSDNAGTAESTTLTIHRERSECRG